MRRPLDRIARSKPLVFAACLLPLAWLVWDTLFGLLGPDPVARIEQRSGDWTLRLLLATLAITPLRRLSGWNGLVRYRRMLGLFAFFYASVHFAAYLLIDLGGYWTQIFGEIAKKPYITAGFAAWLLMLPLALTSTHAMMRRLGRNWQRLHRLIYAAGIAAVLHFVWQVKFGDTIAVREPLWYAGILAVLLLARVPRRRRSTQATRAPSVRSSNNGP